MKRIKAKDHYGYSRSEKGQKLRNGESGIDKKENILVVCCGNCGDYSHIDLSKLKGVTKWADQSLSVYGIDFATTRSNTSFVLNARMTACTLSIGTIRQRWTSSFTILRAWTAFTKVKSNMNPNVPFIIGLIACVVALISSTISFFLAWKDHPYN